MHRSVNNVYIKNFMNDIYTFTVKYKVTQPKINFILPNESQSKLNDIPQPQLNNIHQSKLNIITHPKLNIIIHHELNDIP